MKFYFKLQYTLINRKFKDAGLEPLLAYVFLFLGFIGLSNYLFSSTEFAAYFYLLGTLLLLGKLSETQRTAFLKVCFGELRWIQLRMIENLFCSFPFFLFLLYQHHFLFAFLLVLLAALLVLINYRLTLPYTVWTPFSKHPFEFTTGFRNTFYLFFISYSLALISISVDNFNLGIFALLSVFAITSSYYNKPENTYFVWIYTDKPNDFLIKKIKTALLFSSLIALPIALALLIFYFQNWVYIFLFFLLGWLFQISIVVSKYSVYPNEMTFGEGILLALCVWFPPLFVVLIPYLFKKSKIRLSRLLP